MSPTLCWEAPRGVYGWKLIRLGGPYDLRGLNTVRVAVENEPGAQRPPEGHSHFIFTAKSMKRLDALVWAVTRRLRAERRASFPHKGSAQETVTPTHSTTMGVVPVGGLSESLQAPSPMPPTVVRRPRLPRPLPPPSRVRGA